jgi:hypothetical protein
MNVKYMNDVYEVRNERETQNIDDDDDGDDGE